MEVREALNNLDKIELKKYITNLWSELKDINNSENYINHIPITKDVFSDKTEIIGPMPILNETGCESSLPQMSQLPVSTPEYILNLLSLVAW